MISCNPSYVNTRMTFSAPKETQQTSKASDHSTLEQLSNHFDAIKDLVDSELKANIQAFSEALEQATDRYNTMKERAESRYKELEKSSEAKLKELEASIQDKADNLSNKTTQDIKKKFQDALTDLKKIQDEITKAKMNSNIKKGILENCTNLKSSLENINKAV